jgi:glycosyltransferase involved in cell wall biosynthesis
MKKILLVHNGAELYGGSKSFLIIVKCLVDNQFKIDVVIPSQGELINELKKLNINVKIINSIPSISNQRFKSFKSFYLFIKDFFISTKELINYIKKSKPEIIHINVSTLPSVAFAAMITRTKLIWHIREIYDGAQKYLWFFYQPLIFILSNIIIVNSNATKNQFQKLYHRKIFRLYNSFSPTPIIDFYKKNQIDNFKLRYNIKSDYCVGMVGRINLNRKGQEVFVKAAKITKSKFPNTSFIIIGSPYPGKEFFLEELKVLISKNDLEEYVLLLGEVKNINLAYSLFDIVVIPSTRPESFGNVASESMNFLKPVISSNIGGAKDQIINNKTGLLYNNNDCVSLANKIEILLSNINLRKKYGLAGRDLLEKKFNYNVFSNDLIKIYNNI